MEDLPDETFLEVGIKKSFSKSSISATDKESISFISKYLQMGGLYLLT